MDAWMTSQVAPQGFDKDNIKDPMLLPFPALSLHTQETQSGQLE